MKISVSVLVADMLVLIYLYRYLQKYRLGEYIGIGWTHIGPTLEAGNERMTFLFAEPQADTQLPVRTIPIVVTAGWIWH